MKVLSASKVNSMIDFALIGKVNEKNEEKGQMIQKKKRRK